MLGHTLRRPCNLCKLLCYSTGSLCPAVHLTLVLEVTTWKTSRKMYTQNVSQTIADTRCGFLNRAVRSRPATDKMDSRSGMLALSVGRGHSTFFSTSVMAQTTLSIRINVSVSLPSLFHLISIVTSTSDLMLILLVVLSHPLA